MGQKANTISVTFNIFYRQLYKLVYISQLVIRKINSENEVCEAVFEEDRSLKTDIDFEEIKNVVLQENRAITKI